MDTLNHMERDDLGEGNGVPDDDRLQATVLSWADAERARRAVSTRTAKAVHESLAVDEGRFEGLLLDLAEANTPVRVQCASGRFYSGVILSIGVDHIVLNRNPWDAVESQGLSSSVLIRIDWLMSVSVAEPSRPRRTSRSPLTPSSRTIQRDAPTMWEVISNAAVDDREITAVLRGNNDPLRASLIACGADVATLRTSTQEVELIYVPATHLMEVVVD